MSIAIAPTDEERLRAIGVEHDGHAAWRGTDAIFAFLKERWGSDDERPEFALLLARDVLDDLVLAHKRQEAEDLNEGGYRQQVEYLVGRLDAREAAEQIAERLYRA